MDNAGTVATVCAGYCLDRFNTSEVQGNKDDIEPHRRKHQRPQRDLSLASLDERGKPEMSGNHGARCLDRGSGQGSLASIKPMTTTNANTPKTNCTVVVPYAASA